MKPTLMSVCVPYWERQEALDQMFANYRDLYTTAEAYKDILNLEFSVCDDGSPTQPAVVPSDCILTRLPVKRHPLNPCTPINHAVGFSKGEIIVLTNAEVEHRGPVLVEMRKALGTPQDRRYVVARCREVEGGGWLAGPDVDYTKGGRVPVPPGGHFHFLAMCWRQLWNKAGGFDEDYRNGQACDDNDWLWRLWRVGAQFVTTEGVVWHRRGKRLKWGIPHNRKLLHQKWPQIARLARTHKNANAHSKDRGASMQGERGRVGTRSDLRASGVRTDGVVPTPGDAQSTSEGPGASAEHVGSTPQEHKDAGRVGELVGGEAETSSGVCTRTDVPPGEGAGGGGDAIGVPDPDIGADSNGSKERREGLLHPEWALILGGGELVWEEVLEWEEMYGRQWDGLIIAANDVGSHWPRFLDHWVTLHPDRMRSWLAQRTAYGFSEDYETWGRQPRHVDHGVRPWAGGSSGMLAIQVASILGCCRAVLCGIPMTPTPHFDESIIHASGKPWTSVAGHWRAWNLHIDKMAGWVRSMSGRTQEVLGTPTLAWLREEE